MQDRRTCRSLENVAGLMDREMRSLQCRAAVTAGLTVSYSSGAVEGHVNRIKMIKRQMYGRAKPDLLRKRILLAD